MQFYDDALIIYQRPCGDPRCGLLHPNLVEAEFVAAIVHGDEALVAIVQKKLIDENRETYMALILEPTSIGYLPEQNDRLCVVITQDTAQERAEPMMMVHQDPEALKEMLTKDAAYLHGALFGRIKVPGDEDYQGEQPPSAESAPEPTEEAPETNADGTIDLAALDPSKMPRA